MSVRKKLRKCGKLFYLEESTVLNEDERNNLTELCKNDNTV